MGSRGFARVPSLSPNYSLQLWLRVHIHYTAMDVFTTLVIAIPIAKTDSPQPSKSVSFPNACKEEDEMLGLTDGEKGGMGGNYYCTIA
jgi:hypothetical protein